MELFNHNLQAYHSIMEHLREHDRAAIVHATGTGKSFIIAKVVEHFYPSAIVIAPNNFVLNETRKICPSWVEFRTYASLMYEKNISTDYNAIFLDEFHRAGAEEWGKGVQRLIEANPTAKLIGTSATHIRYLDNARNMADELFDGNIVSHITLGDAIIRNILPNPTYVSSLYDIKETKEKYEERIRNSRLDEDEQHKLLKQLSSVSKNWDQSSGVPNIIRKYFDKDMQRIIVFCSNVERANNMRHIIASWLSSAGYKHVRYYYIDYKEKYLDKEMADFQEPLGDYDLKVAISVNMLNEGIHIPRVDGIIMLRGTISRIIIEQQIGRCLTADAKRTPVILDLVNNMDTVRYDWQGFYREESDQLQSSTNKKDVKEKLPFHIIDETRDLRTFFAQMDSKFCVSWDFESCKAEALKYDKRSHFKIGNCSAYRYALEHKFLDEICSHMVKINTWDYDSCKAEALKYKTRKEFKKCKSGAYRYALEHKFLDEICSHMVKINTWDYDSCKAEALKYKTRRAFYKCSSSAFYYASKHKFLDEICSHMVKINTWDYDSCKAEALKYKTRKEFQMANSSAYCYASKHNIVDDVCSHMPIRNNWDYDSCKKEALKYSTIQEFREGSSGAYQYAYRNNIIDDIGRHLKKQRIKINYEYCKELASKYKKRSQFMKNHGGAYTYARKHNLLDEFFPKK